MHICSACNSRTTNALDDDDDDDNDDDDDDGDDGDEKDPICVCVYSSTCSTPFPIFLILCCFPDFRLVCAARILNERHLLGRRRLI